MSKRTASDVKKDLDELAKKGKRRRAELRSIKSGSRKTTPAMKVRDCNRELEAIARNQERRTGEDDDHYVKRIADGKARELVLRAEIETLGGK